jgi:RPN1 N-terminal domain
VYAATDDILLKKQFSYIIARHVRHFLSFFDQLLFEYCIASFVNTYWISFSYLLCFFNYPL